ncbi:MAG: 50S ribosomal protein L10 [Candidatus Liptonbacteria bacterium]|nr:50S ribosomal protein L10 [Candidatus Liptonbacteria bacterium]
MKSRAHKQEELAKGKELLDKSRFLLFADLSKVSTEALRKLRKELRGAGAQLMVIKKRLLGLIAKERGMAFDPKTHKLQLGTVFAPEAEQSSAAIFRFFKELGEEKTKILGGYDIGERKVLGAEMVQMIGALPPREALLTQLAGTLAAPIRSFLYVLQERSKKMT